MKVFSALVKFCFQTGFIVLGLLPVKPKLILFESFFGKQYSDNPRAIYETIQSEYPDFECIWSADRQNLQVFETNRIPHVKRFSIKWLLLMPRARFWIFNTRIPKWLPKPKHTTYVQTWHGTPLKKIGLDIDDVHMTGVTTDTYKRDLIIETGFWDVLISPNRYSSDIFRHAFHFNKTLLESGYPRNDVLFRENDDATIRRLKNQLHLPPDKKVVLYAPTWRDDQVTQSGRYTLDLKLDLDAMQRALGQDYVLLLRLHYLVATHLDVSDYEGFVFDLSGHEDIRDLYLVSDVLITDYSSVFFDYANLKRPILFFMYDLEAYRDTLRGFYFDIEKEAPGPIVKTTQGLIDEMNRLDEVDFVQSERFQKFYERFCGLEDGQAAKRVADQLLAESQTEKVRG